MQTKKVTRPNTTYASEDVVPVPLDTGIIDEIDDLLDEIDAVLEENALDFVHGYVQKGGQ